MTAAEMDIVIGAQVSGAVNGLKQVNTQLINTERTATQVTAKTGKNFTGLSRVIQDLPFGFIAIQNNLEQLIPASAGAGLALSAVIAAITFAQVGFSNWTRGFEQAKEATDEFSKAAAGAATEATKIKSLFNIARDLGQSTQTRVNAIKELNRISPEHLGNLTLENIRSQEAKNAVDGLTDALARKAKVTAISNLLTKANEELIKNQTQTTLEQANLLNRLILKVTKGGGIFGLSAIASTSASRQDAIKAAQITINDLTKALDSELLKQAQKGEFKVIDPKTIEKSIEKSFNHINPNITGAKNTGIVHFANIFGRTVQKELDIHPLEFKFAPFEGSESAKKAIADMEKLTEIIKSTLINGLSAVGESLGNVLAGAKNPFAPIFAVLSEGLKTLGKAYIQIGVEALIAQKALKLLMESPYLTIAAGIAFVALGQLLQAKAKNVKAFATGGVVTKPTLALVGEQGPERITPLGYEGQANNNWMGGEVVFQISGQNLRGILRRADQTAFNTF